MAFRSYPSGIKPLQRAHAVQRSNGGEPCAELLSEFARATLRVQQSFDAQCDPVIRDFSLLRDRLYDAYPVLRLTLRDVVDALCRPTPEPTSSRP